MATEQQDKVDGTSSEESISYPIMEEDLSDKQQEVYRGGPKVNPEHSSSLKRAKKTSQENPGKQAPSDPSGSLLNQPGEINKNYKTSEVGGNPEN